MNEITRSGLAEALFSREPPILFEALDRKYYDVGHIPTAKVLPPAEIDAIVAAEVSRKDARIILYCASETCRNSHEAAAHLASQGYGNLAVYTGGKQDWRDAGLKLEK